MRLLQSHAEINPISWKFACLFSKDIWEKKRPYERFYCFFFFSEKVGHVETYNFTLKQNSILTKCWTFYFMHYLQTHTGKQPYSCKADKCFFSRNWKEKPYCINEPNFIKPFGNTRKKNILLSNLYIFIFRYLVPPVKAFTDSWEDASSITTILTSSNLESTVKHSHDAYEQILLKNWFLFWSLKLRSVKPNQYLDGELRTLGTTSDFLATEICLRFK